MSFNKEKMNFLEARKIEREDSLEEFEFFDAEGDLDVDLSKSPIHGAAQSVASGLGLIISTLCAIVEEQGLEVNIPIKALASTAVGALTGSLIGGPSGLAVGLITGAVIAYRTSPSRSRSEKTERPKFSIREVLGSLTLHQKKELLKELLGCLKQSNVRSLIIEILKNEEIRNMALEILSSFLVKKMGISLTKRK